MWEKGFSVPSLLVDAFSEYCPLYSPFQTVNYCLDTCLDHGQRRDCGGRVIILLSVTHGHFAKKASQHLIREKCNKVSTQSVKNDNKISHKYSHISRRHSF